MPDTRRAKPPIGWPLLPTPSNGAFGYPSLEESIKQSIKVILLTRPGEQLMRPGFGAGLKNYLHEPNTLTTRRRIRDLVTDSMARWEPRIVVDRVEVREVPEHLTQIRVELSYRVKRTGQTQQMGITMELEA